MTKSVQDQNPVSDFAPASPTFTSETLKYNNRSAVDSLDQIFSSPSPAKSKKADERTPQEGLMDNIAAKARELKYSLQEWILMKSIVFSLVVFLAFVMLTYFVMNLAGGYLPVLILSILASTALRPTKDAVSSNIKRILGITGHSNQNTSFFRGSLVLLAWKSVKELVNYKQNKLVTRKRKQKINAFFNYFNPTGDIYAIFCACLVWILVSRFGIEIVLYIVGIVILVDIAFRLLLDCLTFLSNQSTCLKKAKVRIQRNKNFSAAIDSSVATAVLLGFLILSLGFILFMIFLLVVDIETIVFNLRSSMMVLIQNINQKVSEYSGIENAIDENFVVGFIRNYNESIYSYMENQDLKGVYFLFSGIVNPVKNATMNSTFGEFPSVLSNNSLEFQDCLNQNKLNVSLSIIRDLEAIYCSLLPYTRRFSIDPFTTFKRIQGGILFIFQLLFGTILFELYLFSKAALDYAFNIMVFCFCVYYLLHANRSAIDSATRLLPLNQKVRSELHDALVKSIKGSFLCSIKIFIYHFLFTWLCFDILQLNLGFTISIAASIFSMLPFIPSWSLCIPHAIYLYMGRDNLLAGILLPTVYFIVSNKVYNDIYKKSIDIHPYLTGLSIVMGIYAFDVQGIIYGPLLMCITLIVIELVKKYGINADAMLKIHRKRIILEKLDSLERIRSTDRRIDRGQSHQRL